MFFHTDVEDFAAVVHEVADLIQRRVHPVVGQVQVIVKHFSRRPAA